MGKFGGFGGMGNMQQLMKQAQKMQANMSACILPSGEYRDTSSGYPGLPWACPGPET